MEAAPFVAVSLLILLVLGLVVGLLAVKHRRSRGRDRPDSAERR